MKFIDLFLWASGVFLGFSIGLLAMSGDYDRGQKDALNGKQAWVKLEDADGKEYVVKKESK